MFLLFQSMGTSPDCHNFSNMMNGGLATSSTSSLRTYGSISSGPCAASCSLDGLELNLLLHWVVLHHPSPRFACCDPGDMAGTLASEGQGKKVLEYLAFFTAWVTRSPTSFGEGLHFSKSFFYQQHSYKCFSCCP